MNIFQKIYIKERTTCDFRETIDEPFAKIQHIEPSVGNPGRLLSGRFSESCIELHGVLTSHGRLLFMDKYGRPLFCIALILTWSALYVTDRKTQNPGIEHERMYFWDNAEHKNRAASHARATQ